MTSILLLGLMIGMKHALEADHVAAVAALASRSRSTSDIVIQGTAWSIGHTVTLFVVASVVLAFDTLVPQHVAQALELAVGVMLVVMGADVIRRMIRERIHFHAHTHGPQKHFHAHSHAGDQTHSRSAHAHAHPQPVLKRRLPGRALAIGFVHGLAGSAALIVMTIAATDSVAMGFLYVAVFGLGSIAGMAALSLAIALPLRFSAQRANRAFQVLQMGIGLVTIGIGVNLIYQMA